MRHPKLRPDPGPHPLPGQAALFGFEEAPRQARQLSANPKLPSYGPFELVAPPGAAAEDQPEPNLSLPAEEGSDHAR